MRRSWRRSAAVAASSVALGAAIVAAARLSSGHDPAFTLASALGFPSGIPLGALLGGLLGVWLALGGSRRVARTAGFVLGIAFLYVAWRLAEPYLWMLDVILREAFGEGGQQYSGLVVFLIAIPLYRTVAEAGTGLVAGLLGRQQGQPIRSGQLTLAKGGLPSHTRPDQRLAAGRRQGPMGRIRLALLGTFLAATTVSAGAVPRSAAAPSTGALILTPLTPYLSVCLGDQAAVDVFLVDSVYGMPPGGATITMASALGAADAVFTPGGTTRLMYRPRTEGNDTIQITATAPTSGAALATVVAKVQRCRWTWDLFYTGAYPHPEGFWKFSEQATVAAGTLETVSGGPVVQGSGTVAYAISAHGEVSQASCDIAEMAGTTTVEVNGRVGEPVGSMKLEFLFDPAPISGQASFDCRFGPDQVSLVIPVNETSAALSSLPLEQIVVRTDFGLISRSVPTAIFWLVSGSGRLTLVVAAAPDN